jgi:hypothetical protein
MSEIRCLYDMLAPRHRHGVDQHIQRVGGNVCRISTSSAMARKIDSRRGEFAG